MSPLSYSVSFLIRGLRPGVEPSAGFCREQPREGHSATARFFFCFAYIIQVNCIYGVVLLGFVLLCMVLCLSIWSLFLIIKLAVKNDISGTVFDL